MSRRDRDRIRTTNTIFVFIVHPRKMFQILWALSYSNHAWQKDRHRLSAFLQPTVHTFLMVRQVDEEEERECSIVLVMLVQQVEHPPYREVQLSLNYQCETKLSSHLLGCTNGPIGPLEFSGNVDLVKWVGPILGKISTIPHRIPMADKACNWLQNTICYTGTIVETVKLKFHLELHFTLDCYLNG